MKKLLTIFLFILFLAGCSETGAPYTIYDAKADLIIASELENETLPNEFRGFTLTWTASKPQFLDGFLLIQSYEDISIQLTVTVSDGENSTSKNFDVVILQNPDLENPNQLSISEINEILNSLNIPEESHDDLFLPNSFMGVDITWSSANSDLIDDNGIVTRPTFEEGDELITLTATGTSGENVSSVFFTVNVVALPEEIDEDLLYFEEIIENFIFNYSIVSNDLYLPSTAGNVAVTWESSNEMYLTDGGFVTQPFFETGDQVVVLTAIFTYQEYEIELEYHITIEALEATFNEYYQGAEGLEGDILKSFLHDLIDDHTIYSYSALWDALSQTDEDPNNPNNVILFYTGRSQDKDAHGGNADDWNREHVWAKSHGDFGNLNGPGTDMHHIRPTDASVNSSRGNLDFDNGGNAVYDGGTLTANYRDSDSFEPRDEVKGDVARMIFYMAVRYEGDDGFVDLEVNDSVNNSGPFMGRLSVLMEWHLEDPPDEFELNRNEVIYTLQGNRNPFIDYPEFVELIWGD